MYMESFLEQRESVKYSQASYLNEMAQNDDYVPSNNEIGNSIVFSDTEHFGDHSVMSEDKKQSGDIDSSPTLVRPSRSDGRLTRETSIERNSSCFVGDVTKSPEVHFVTGSCYEGTWDALGMSGVGRYTMPHGTIYEGQLRDGMFHGRGSLYWSKNQRLDVLHLRGELKENRQTSNDGFILDDKDWSYCKFPDRRFYASIKKGGLRPGGRTLKTARQPSKILPYGCYDTGDGIFDPKTQRITSYDDPNKVLRIPSQEEYTWIVKMCRKNWTEPTGYRPELNENWSENPPELPYSLPMSQDSPDNWWRRLTTFPRDYNFLGGQNEKVSNGYAHGTFSTPEERMFGKSLILGGPCYCIPISTSFEAEEMEYIGKTFVSEETSNSSFDISSEECWESRRDDKRASRSWGTSKRAEQNTNGSGQIVGPKDSRELEMHRSKRNIYGKRPAMKISDDKKVSNVAKSMNEPKIRRPSTFVVEVGNEKNNGQPRHEFDAKTLEKTLQKKNDKKNNDSAEETVEDIFPQKYVEPTPEGNAKPPSQYLDKKLSIEGLVPSPRKSASAEKKLDYTSEFIPREKLSRARKPETSGNGRRLETKGDLSEKATKEEIDKQYNSYISRDSSDVNAVKSNQYFINEYQEETDIGKSNSIDTEEILDKNIESKHDNSQSSDNQVLLHEAVTARWKNDDDDDYNELSTGENIEIAEAAKSMAKEKSKNSSGEILFDEATMEIRSEKIQAADEDGVKIVQFEREPASSDTTVLESEKKLSTKMAHSTTDDNDAGSRLCTKLPSIPEIMISETSSVTLRSMDEKSTSVFDNTSLEESESCSMKANSTSLDKVHPSLVTLISINPELPKEMRDTNKGCQKCPSKRELEVEPKNVNVWRLSGVNQNYGPKTKIEDLLFHPALTAPRSENVEYTRKQCSNNSLCGTTLRDTKTSASRARKQQPSKILAKSAHSRLDRNLNNRK